VNDGPSIRRRLAAILAADIAGYSRLMGEDEAAHLFLETEPAFGQFREHVRAFLAG
jgi:hypothetical protein